MSTEKRAAWLCVVAAAALLGGALGQVRPGGGATIDPWDPLGKKTTTRPAGAERPADEVVVPTSLGRVVGRRVLLPRLAWTADRDARDVAPDDRGPIDPNPLPRENDVSVFVFLGVPYAEKPVSSRRLNPPQRLRRFEGDGELTAFEYRAACSQDVDARATLWFDEPYEWNVDEDCLYLNIFSPQVSAASQQSYPVIVFLHGGGFQTGSANDWPGHVLASRGVVVVTVNYRLGPLGFLSLGDSSSGNYGLMDQRMALEWVRDYIDQFGGDQRRVTLVGHGAGAVSAGLHMLSPDSASLFHAVGAMSGADVSYHQVISKPALAFNNTLKLGRRVGCSQATANEVWGCLLGRSANDLVQGAGSMRIEYNRYAFLPTVDERVLPDAPVVMLQRAALSSAVPYLTGVNRNDGTQALLAERDLAEFVDFNVDQEFVDFKLLDYTLKHNYTTNREAIIQAIKYQYTYWPDRRRTDKIRDEFINFASDAYYVAPVSQSAQLHSEAGSITYMYVNNYNLSTGRLNPEDNLLPGWMGVCHECDLYLLFGFPWMPPQLLPQHLRAAKWTQTDKNASELFMALWRQFAKNKNPNLQLDSTWLNYSPRDHHYLDFNYTMTLRRDYDWSHVAFWNHYIDQLALLYTTTYSPDLASMRRELVGFKVAMAGCIFVFLLIAFLAGVFAYLLFDRRQRSRRQPPLVAHAYPTASWTPPLPPRAAGRPAVARSKV